MKKMIILPVLFCMLFFMALGLSARPSWNSMNRYDMYLGMNSSQSIADRYSLGNRSAQQEEELTPEERERKLMKEKYDDLQFLPPIEGLLFGHIPARAGHYGVDVKAPLYHPVIASQSGTVEFADWAGNYGKVIFINHSGGYQTRYSHLSRFEVEEGDRVERGQVIGYIGLTGRTCGPHVHYEVRERTGGNYYHDIYSTIPVRHMHYVLHIPF